MLTPPHPEIVDNLDIPPIQNPGKYTGVRHYTHPLIALSQVGEQPPRSSIPRLLPLSPSVACRLLSLPYLSRFPPILTARAVGERPKLPQGVWGGGSDKI